MKLSLFLIFFIFSACVTPVKETEKKASGSRQWLNEKITKLNPLVKPGYGITQTVVDGKSFYTFPAPSCCDLYDEVYSADGKLICHPSGGIMGKGDGKCGNTLKGQNTVTATIWVKK